MLCGRRSFDEAMGDRQRKRDEEAMPRYEFATQLGTLAPPPPELQHLLASIAADSAAMNGFAGVVAGAVSADDFFTSVGSLHAAS